MTYNAHMSDGNDIEVDKDEIEKIMLAASHRALCVCKRGIINPAYLVAIEPTYSRSNIPEVRLKDLFPELRKKIKGTGQVPQLHD